MRGYADINLLLSIAVAILSLLIISPYVFTYEATRTASVGEREARVAERESSVAARESNLYWKSIPPPDVTQDEEEECNHDTILLRELEFTKREAGLHKREASIARREAWLVDNWWVKSGIYETL
ncbi:hypothetical protein E3P77_01543 [Wallemia ichthyophaga]|uniref:Uncharacterized protein n=1 Tax=Wallemia ichthyophaga TaxID=245174 RepID=A0A4T0EF50_WALIC|nr:hypothetical protein E3P91_01725 [Wallemia ichthyophaga]TIA91488.1 hypothetical protein E3P97_01943 [Wallemia ichthyophaga]TIB00488.1 hypothetical protein E3P95_01653 [Wallemia ichthyophaga]TIB01589.1 hypothetical protein E3P94_01689 [Wallemia ichthyophaga]TIB12980.1 hypothetical protein E3P90_01778 [Wallemia ichthyophaga]